MADHLQLMEQAVRKAGSDVSTVADHLDGISYLTPSEGASLTAALAYIAQQAERVRARVDAIEEHQPGEKA